MNNQFNDDEQKTPSSLQKDIALKDEMINTLKAIVKQYQDIVKDQSEQIGLLTSLLKIYSKPNKDN